MQFCTTISLVVLAVLVVGIIETSALPSERPYRSAAPTLEEREIFQLLNPGKPIPEELYKRSANQDEREVFQLLNPGKPIPPELYKRSAGKDSNEPDLMSLGL